MTSKLDPELLRAYAETDYIVSDDPPLDMDLDFDAPFDDGPMDFDFDYDFDGPIDFDFDFDGFPPLEEM